MGGMNEALRFIVDTNLMEFIIGALGIFGFILIGERFKALYLDYSMDAQAFMNQVRSFIESDKIEAAITFCAANEKKPLAYVIKRILERADRDEASMEQALDISVSEMAPLLIKRLGYLAMVSNVVTLVGLLGTVCGLIMSFKAVSFADPSQKQLLLAQGISLAMTATAMGLCVAIPVMVVYSFLHAKQSRLFNEMDQYSSTTMDFLKSRGYKAFSEQTAFPESVSLNAGVLDSKKASPPMNSNKAS